MFCLKQKMDTMCVQDAVREAKVMAKLIGLAGFFLLMFTAGGSDANTLPMAQIIVQAGISLAMIVVALKMGGAFDV